MALLFKTVIGRAKACAEAENSKRRVAWFGSVTFGKYVATQRGEAATQRVIGQQGRPNGVEGREQLSKEGRERRGRAKNAFFSKSFRLLTGARAAFKRPWGKHLGGREKSFRKTAE